MYTLLYDVSAQPCRQLRGEHHHRAVRRAGAGGVGPGQEAALHLVRLLREVSHLQTLPGNIITVSYVTQSTNWQSGAKNESKIPRAGVKCHVTPLAAEGWAGWVCLWPGLDKPHKITVSKEVI